MSHSRLRSRVIARGTLAITLAVAAPAVACQGEEGSSLPSDGSVAEASSSVDPSAASQDIDDVIDIGNGRSLYVRCTGTGSPTVLMEGGDGDTSDSYAFAEPSIAEVTRVCVYDRANLGQSGPARGPRELKDYVQDLESLLGAAEIDGPYVLVGTSGGGFITAGYAVTHPKDVAGMVLIDTGAPFRNPPAPVVEETTWNNPANIEQRDYLQIEKDAWRARERVGDIPVSIITVKYSSADIKASPFASERAGMKRNVEAQQGWLVLSPRAEQIVVRTGHAVEEEDPEFVIDVILDVVQAAR